MINDFSTLKKLQIWDTNILKLIPVKLYSICILYYFNREQKNGYLTATKLDQTYKN